LKIKGQKATLAKIEIRNIFCLIVLAASERFGVTISNLNNATANLNSG